MRDVAPTVISPRWLQGLASAVVAVLALTTLPSLRASAQEHYPQQHWERVRSPERLGWSSAKLRLAREYSESIGSAAVVIVVDARILAEWGETSRRFRAHSMRKSLLNALYGIHVHAGDIDLDKTLEELGIDDNEPLTPGEKQATIRHLLQGRSGVYIPALYLGGSLDLPPRGSFAPGTFHVYNNWDFNVLGAIFEQETHTKIFEEFNRRIAEPLQMEDFRVEDGTYFYGSHSDYEDTRYPAYPFRISARDLARFGLLYLRNGRWRDEQIVPAAWIAESLTPYSVIGEHARYGYTNWRIYLEGKQLPGGARLAGDIYWTSGIDVHRLYLVPWLDLVVVHRVNSDFPGPRPSKDEVDRLLALILDAKIADLGRALLDAAAKGDSAVVQGLVEGGAELAVVNEMEQTPVHLAAQAGHTTALQVLLSAGANVGTGDTLGMTPLMLAALGGHVAAVRTLLEGGADVNARGRHYGETALMYAALNGDTAVVNALVAGGADVDAACTNGRTALMLAEAAGHSSTVKLLESAGAAAGASAALLPPAAYLPPWIAREARRGRLRNPYAAQALLTRGAAMRADGDTALLVAAVRGNAATVQNLFAAGADVGVKAKYGWTALLLAAANGHTEVVRALLEAGADIDATERRLGQTALAWAAKEGHVGAVRVLLDGGARIDARDRFGGTALTRAAAGGHTTTVQALLAAAADVHAKEKDGDTALLEAVAGGHTATMQALLQAGADINASDNDGRTALMVAAMSGRDAIVRDLLAAGADVNRRDNFGSTALTQATTLGHTAVIQLLQEAGGKR